MSNGADGGPLLSALVTMIQETDKWDALDEAPRRAYGPVENAPSASPPASTQTRDH